MGVSSTANKHQTSNKTIGIKKKEKEQKNWQQKSINGMYK